MVTLKAHRTFIELTEKLLEVLDVVFEWIENYVGPCYLKALLYYAILYAIFLGLF